MILTICILAVALVVVGVMWWRYATKKNALFKMYRQGAKLSKSTESEEAKEIDPYYSVESLPNRPFNDDEYFITQNNHFYYVGGVKTIEVEYGKYEYRAEIIKCFLKNDDPDFARLQAEELLEKLNER